MLEFAVYFGSKLSRIPCTVQSGSKDQLSRSAHTSCFVKTHRATKNAKRPRRVKRLDPRLSRAASRRPPSLTRYNYPGDHKQCRAGGWAADASRPRRYDGRCFPLAQSFAPRGPPSPRRGPHPAADPSVHCAALLHTKQTTTKRDSVSRPFVVF